MDRLRNSGEDKPPGTLQQYLEACLLLILRKGKCHGYELTKSLEAYGMGNKAPGPVYRTLRKMEALGLIKSQWDTLSKRGSARRVYNITSEGHAHLKKTASALHELVNTLSAFLKDVGIQEGDENSVS
ncbi:MAG: helix-turn-helix transcriptional regulator [Nitrospirae bacterium]|nr:helix-turn-helix transcriptional regulator [Nitrospirota bacterium]